MAVVVSQDVETALEEIVVVAVVVLMVMILVDVVVGIHRLGLWGLWLRYVDGWG